MTQAQQTEALRLAAICETKGMFPVADELNRMHARILELEQGKCLHQIAEPAEDIWPCINIDVDEHGAITNAKLYSPGLPAGNHDVYPVRVPYMDEHTEAWLTCVKELERFDSSFLNREGMNGIECAASVIRELVSRAQLAAAPQAVQPAVPVGGQSRFKGEKDWQWCAAEHVAMVLATPSEWQNYEVRYVYAHPAEGIQSHAEAAAAVCINSALKRIHAGKPSEAVAPLEHALSALAHLSEAVPAQCPNINEPRGCWRVACQLGGKCREPERAATQPAARGLVERDEALEAVRKAFCKLQRYSFFLDSRGNVRRCADHCGNWVEFEAVHTLFEPQAVDAALAAQAKQGGEA